MDKISVTKPWGNFEQFTHNEISTVKLLNVKPDSKLSYQYHKHRSEFWRVMDGEGIIILDDVEHKVKKDDEFFIPNNVKHRIITGSDHLQILEISFGEFDEEDIVRLEDSYGRV